MPLRALGVLKNFGKHAYVNTKNTQKVESSKKAALEPTSRSSGKENKLQVCK